MKTQSEIDLQVEKTLARLDNLRKATANPFFYTRLKSKLEQPPVRFMSSSWELRIGVASLVLLIALNIVSLLRLTTRQQGTPQTTVESFAREYGLYDSDVYERQ